MDAALKAVEHGNIVYILPNPSGTKTPDFVFFRKGIVKAYDLKTISGTNSADNRLLGSKGQTNRVLLRMTVDYNPRTLAKNIKSYFESNPDALEVLIYKGMKEISIDRDKIDKNFVKEFMRRYNK